MQPCWAAYIAILAQVGGSRLGIHTCLWRICYPHSRRCASCSIAGIIIITIILCAVCVRARHSYASERVCVCVFACWLP